MKETKTKINKGFTGINNLYSKDIVNAYVLLILSDERLNKKDINDIIQELHFNIE